MSSDSISKREDRWGTTILALFISLSMQAIAYCLFLTRNHFSMDGYLNYYVYDIDVHLRNGRLMAWIVASILKRFDINLLHHQFIATVLFILASSLCATYLYMLMTKKTQKSYSQIQLIAIVMAINISFENPFFWEWYTFVESYAWYIVSIIFALTAIGIFNKNNSIVLSGILLACCMLTYQVVLPMAAIWGITIIAFNNGLSFGKVFYKKAIRLFFACVLGGVIGLLIPKNLDHLQIISFSRSAELSLSSILTNTTTLLDFLYQYFCLGGTFFPRYANLLFVVVSCVLIVILSIINKRSFATGIQAVVMLGISFFTAIATNLVAEGAITPPRRFVGIYCFWSMLFVCLIILADSKREDYRKTETIIVVMVMIAFTILNLKTIWGATRAHFVANDEDEAYAQRVEECIEAYEANTGMVIDCIHFANDISPTYYTEAMDRYRFGGTNMLSAPIYWATVYLINYYAGREYDGLQMTIDEVESRFGTNVDYTEFESSQLVFEGNDAYLLVY